jgi:hypothetical protein
MIVAAGNWSVMCEMNLLVVCGVCEFFADQKLDLKYLFKSFKTIVLKTWRSP